MEKREINIPKSLILNIFICIILTFITLILIFQLGDYYIENNPLNQFGPIYRDKSIGASMELGRMINDVSGYPDETEIFLLQLKMIFNGNFDISIAYITFSIYFILIYSIKYLKIKFV